MKHVCQKLITLCSYRVCDRERGKRREDEATGAITTMCVTPCETGRVCVLYVCLVSVHKVEEKMREASAGLCAASTLFEL